MRVFFSYNFMIVRQKFIFKKWKIRIVFEKKLFLEMEKIEGFILEFMVTLQGKQIIILNFWFLNY